MPCARAASISVSISAAAARSSRQARDQRAMKLPGSRRQPRQQRRIDHVGADAVEHEADAEVVQIRDDARVALGEPRQRRGGNFQFDQRGVEAVVVERARQHLSEIVSGELHRRYVDRQAHRVRPQKTPFGRVPARAQDDPVAESAHVAALFGGGDERFRRERRHRQAIPSQQRFDADQRTAVDAPARLESAARSRRDPVAAGAAIRPGALLRRMQRVADQPRAAEIDGGDQRGHQPAPHLRRRRRFRRARRRSGSSQTRGRSSSAAA